MRLRRVRPKRTRRAFGLTISMLVLLPTTIGLQDPASAIARQSSNADLVRQQLMTSPFGTIHPATFSLPRPVGSAIPISGYRLAGLDLSEVDITGSVDRNRFYGAIESEPRRVFPSVNREGKGDRLTPSPAPARGPAASSPAEPSSENPGENPGEGSSLDMLPAYDISASLEMYPQIPLGDVTRPRTDLDATPTTRDREDIAASEESQPPAPPFVVELPEQVPVDNRLVAVLEAEDDSRTPAFISNSSAAMTARVYFGSAPMGAGDDRIVPWAEGAAPILESPDANDPDLKQLKPAAAPAAVAAATTGETVAHKGEVTGAGKRPKTPAERLGLAGAVRAKQEKCLTDAVYFESRGEAVNGQIAVAQVVMNRVFSGFYPTTVCAVVYQKKYVRRIGGCQFSFSCDGIPDVVKEPEAWEIAKKIARDTLDGKLWLTSVGKATHYHAFWVRPNWIREMAKLQRLGVHTFYRPRAWGDGADEPKWGDPAATKAEVAKLTAEAKL